MGDPQGIGPEVIAKALRSPRVRRICRPLLFGDPRYFDFRLARRLTPRQCGLLSAFFIKQAAQAALQGAIGGIVTGPISKERLQLAGYRYPGHTEFFADLSGTKRFRMMMAGPGLRVVLVTIHEPVKKIPGLLTLPRILDTIRLTDRSLRQWFHVKKPRLGVAALNPHAGEGGLFGKEERIIRSAVRAARRRRIDAVGPLSPDTVFHRAVQGEFDAVVCMYHDQGLIPLKLLHFDTAVNITLGLPFVRTSVDHGTAFDIAGKGVADPSSMIAAIEMAVRLTTNAPPAPPPPPPHT